jgi:hypothetical protein
MADVREQRDVVRGARQLELVPVARQRMNVTVEDCPLEDMRPVERRDARARGTPQRSAPYP